MTAVHYEFAAALAAASSAGLRGTKCARAAQYLARPAKTRGQAPSRGYTRGDDQEKCAARMRLYAEFATAPRGSWVVILGGTQPEGEVSAALAAGFQADNLVVCDTVEAGALDRVRATGIRAEQRDVVGLLAELDGVSVANLDFCGLGRWEMEAVTTAARALVPGGMVGLTWPCGRDAEVLAVDRDRDAAVDALVRTAGALAERQFSRVLVGHYTRAGHGSVMAMGYGAWRVT